MIHHWLAPFLFTMLLPLQAHTPAQERPPACEGGDIAAFINQQKTSENAAQNHIDDDFILVKGGQFTMGSPENEKDRGSDETQHEVKLSDFYISKYEVTQQLWTDIMGANPSKFPDCAQCPVEYVSWDQVQDFLKKLNAKYPGKHYRLPTEAEWEYAARGGQSSNGYRYAGSNDIAEVAWYDSNAERKTHPVGEKKANELGLYDMSGNVWEWCGDWYGIYPTDLETDPVGPASGSYRVLRGGSWPYDPLYCRVTNRTNATPVERSDFLGFRLVRAL